ncbi:hypothetical protein PG997_007478 [Apiospora hydei]|uniref:Uncharacterized protein n=1 Tax=Apiospora hydei TaxID=1337664 RepID=A0ABR1W852_9PEZI
MVRLGLYQLGLQYSKDQTTKIITVHVGDKLPPSKMGVSFYMLAANRIVKQHLTVASVFLSRMCYRVPFQLRKVATANPDAQDMSHKGYLEALFCFTTSSRLLHAHTAKATSAVYTFLDTTIPNRKKATPALAQALGHFIRHTYGLPMVLDHILDEIGEGEKPPHQIAFVVLLRIILDTARINLFARILVHSLSVCSGWSDPELRLQWQGSDLVSIARGYKNFGLLRRHLIVLQATEMDVPVEYHFERQWVADWNLEWLFGTTVKALRGQPGLKDFKLQHVLDPSDEYFKAEELSLGSQDSVAKASDDVFWPAD